MSEQENLRQVQELYASFGRGDLPSVVDALTTEDVEWYLPGSPQIISLPGLGRGQQQVEKFFATLLETLELEQFEPQEFIAQGDKVVVSGRSRYRTKTTGQVESMVGA